MVLLLARFLGALASYGRTPQIAFAVAFGITLAIIPGGTLVWLILFIPVLLVRINQAALLGSMGLVRLAAPLIDPVSERIGYALLTVPGAAPALGGLYRIPGIPLLRLNDSLISGSIVAGVLGWPVFFALSLGLIVLYRRYLAAGVKDLTRRIGAKVPVLGLFGKAYTAARTLGG